jgi:predicted exporter
MADASLRRARLRSLLVVLIVAAAWLATLPRLRLTTAITYFLPELADQRAGRLAKELAEGELSRTVILDVSGDEPAAVGQTARRLMTALETDPATESVRSGLDEAAQGRVLELLTHRSPTAFLDASELDDAAISARLEQQKRRLTSPLGPFVRNLVPSDPLGGTLGVLERLADLDSGRTTSQDGILFTADQKHAFVFATTRAGAFDAAAQRAYLDRAHAAFLAARSSPAERLETSGIGQITVAAESQIRGDIERIGGLSTLGIVLLFAGLFRSPRMLGLGLVPLWFGSAVAIVLSHWVFGELHGLTLAFGSSLLGVGIDYAEHYFSHFALTPERGPRAVMTNVWPGLWMGALTTVIGFSGLGLTGFPGIRQIAFFSAVAIGAALLGTRWLLPPWMPATYRRPRLMDWLEAWTERLVELGRRRPRVLFSGLVSGLVVVALVPGLVRARFVDDVSALLAIDPALMAEDARVRERVSPFDPGRFVVIVRHEEEEALQALERTSAALAAAQRDGLVDGYAPLGALVRSRASQQASFERARRERERLTALMAAQGFVPSALSPFFDALERDGPELVTLADVKASPLGGVVASLSPRLREGQAFVIPLRGVHDARALRGRLPEATVLDEPALLEDTYGAVRRHTMRMLVVGMLLVAATLAVRYRSPRLVLAALVPGSLGAIGAISIAGLAGTPVNVLHLVGLLLVLSMGVDYGIFVVEGRESAKTSAHSLVSIITATTTTLLSFGLLASSPSPALRALGTTITIGLLLSALLCPLASILISISPATPRHGR